MVSELVVRAGAAVAGEDDGIALAATSRLEAKVTPAVWVPEFVGAVVNPVATVTVQDVPMLSAAPPAVKVTAVQDEPCRSI
jgi:hypothetical protein